MDPASSLFLMGWGSNVGYALEPLERTFFEIGLRIAGGDSRRVFFGYGNLERGHPRSLPKDFQNFAVLDFTSPARMNLHRIASYVAEHGIRLVWLLDAEPLHPLFPLLRRAGATTIVSYWGAPISARKPLWKLLVKRIEVAASRSKLDALVFESRAMADRAIYGRGVPSRMVHVVPLGVDTSRFRPMKSDYAHHTLGIASDKKIVIYAGHVDRRKGVHVLVEAAIELLHRRGRSDVCFVLCGNRGSQSTEFERMYSGLGIDNEIRFGGYRSDLSQIYPGSFCGVIASAEWDSFPRTSLEMAASGLPIVASNLDGLPEAVLDRETGLLFPTGDARLLADGLQELLDAPEFAAELGRRGRSRCEREFSLEIQRDRLVSIASSYLAASSSKTRPH